VILSKILVFEIMEVEKQYFKTVWVMLSDSIMAVGLPEHTSGLQLISNSVIVAVNNLDPGDLE
jgi:hypothetical protein